MIIDDGQEVLWIGWSQPHVNVLVSLSREIGNVYYWRISE